VDRIYLESLTGCTKISLCKHCYAGVWQNACKQWATNYVNGFKLTMHESALEKPLEWKKPQMIFVNSMSDLFHKDVPFEFIEKVFNVMKRAHGINSRCLRKRAERVAELSPYLEWADNIWMGVSVENEIINLGLIAYVKQAQGQFLSLSRWSVAWEAKSQKHQLGDCGRWVRSGARRYCRNGSRTFGISAESQRPFSSNNGVACRKSERENLEGRTWDEIRSGWIW